MSEPVALARQATFNTEPAESVVCGGSIRRGNIELPVVDTANARTKTKSTDRNNNDSDHGNRNIDNGRNLSAVNVNDDESDTDVNHSSLGQRVYNQQTKNGPPSNQSSPIYGSKSAYDKFNKKYAPTRAVKHTPSIYDDSSDLEILSDVGFADDSDCDVVPVVTPLSLSAKRKTRKEPRIKIPTSKLDNTEPTIQEETTQDILNIQTPELSSGLIPLKSKTNLLRQLRSQTVVFEKHLEPVADETLLVENDDKVVLAENVKLKPNISSTLVSKPIENIGNTKEERLLKATPLNNLEILSAFKDELESSFCESDWQPRKSDHDDQVTSSHPQDVDDKKIITKKYDKTFRQGQKNVKVPFTAREPKVSCIEDQIDASRPRSAGDKPKLKETVPGSQRPKGAKTLEFNLDPADSRPPSRSVPTPIISNFLEEGRRSTDIEYKKTTDIESKKTTDIESKKTTVCGVPRRADTNSRDILPKNNRRADQLLSPSRVKPSGNMESSEGYDYESETFEEILQDRNAMVRAERTYQKRIKQLEDELKGMINQCQALSDENKDLRKTIEGLKKAEKSETKPEVDESSVQLTARVAKLEAEKENLMKLNEKLSSPVKVESTKTKQSDAVFVENTKLKNKNTELEKRIQILTDEIEVLNSKLKEASTNTSGNSAVLEFKNKELEVAVDELKYEKRGLVSKVKSLENDKHLITNSLEEKRIELNEMMRAMQNETGTESELKQSKAKLEFAQEELDSVKNDLEVMKSMLKESESKKERLQNGLAQKDSEMRRIKGEQENKDKIIHDLRSTNEKLRGEISRHEENRQVYKDMEHETVALKSRIASLKTEIESSLAENQRLKYEREEANREIVRLRNENVATADAVVESRRYFRKWETERESRNKAEVELAKKQDEVSGLHASLKESGMKINQLYGRVRAAEEDKEKFRGPNGQELETNNKILRDENKKLRQMLIERNVELTNKSNEKDVLDNRIGILEKKQKDAEFRVKQLSGWVGSMNSNDSKASESQKNNKHPNNVQHVHSHTSVSNVSKSQTHTSNQAFKHSPPKRTGVKEPIIAVISPRSRKKRTAPSTMTPPPSWDERGKYNHDVEGSNHTPISLPLINESSNPRTPNTDFNGGYFHMYKERMKKARDRQFPLD